MAQDRIQGNKTPNWTNRDRVAGQRLDAATYIGIVKNNVDPTRSGRLQVWIPEFGGVQDAVSQTDPVFWRTVNYASPYFGSTFQPEANKINEFEKTNQTYGMWMVPPDVGNQVLCTFVNGDPNRGYWFACVNPTLSHYMVPGMAAGNKLANASPAIKDSIVKDSQPPQSLPVAEFNENQPNAINSSFYENPKPIHDFQANVLFKQGLDRDSTRGAISSSSQRESPSHVFGISTPGRAFGNDPADDPTYQEKLAAGKVSQTDYAVKTRKGGHQFVMDDGDMMGQDQLVRLRSAAGHQILMHDTKKVMYIANSEGSVWIELAESGHMHIYTAGGFNLRSEGDLNFHGRNIRMQAESDFNVSAGGGFNVSGGSLSLTGISSALLYGGKVNIGSGASMTLGASQITVGSTGAIEINGSTIDLNKGEGGNSIGAQVLQANAHDDTTYDTKTRLWSSVSRAASSIVGIMPAHEPWARNASTLGPAPEKQVSSSECPPKSASASNIAGLNVTGSGMEELAQNLLIASGVTDPIKLAAIMAQCKQECAWKYVEEIADGSAYEGRDDLHGLKAPRGPQQPGDGKKYKGRGMLGLTGRYNYTKAAEFFGVDLVNSPQLIAEDLQLSAKTILYYFQVLVNGKVVTKSNGQRVQPFSWNSYVWDDVEAMTRIVNGGLNGYAERQRYFEEYKQKYRNGVPGLTQVPPNNGAVTVQSGSGAPVTNGSGQPVNTGTGNTTDKTSTEKTDVGITKSSGKSMVGETCPIEFLGKTEAYKPPGGIGSGKPTLTQNHAKAMHAELGYMESKWEYDLETEQEVGESATIGVRVGKYQIDAPYLADSARGYVKTDAVTQYGSLTMYNDSSYTGKEKVNSLTTFKEYKNVQDQIQFEEFNANYNALKANGGIKESDDVCIAAGMLFVAHQMRSADKAKEWRDKGELTDVRGVPGEVYFNHGRYAIDVLAAGAATTGGTTTSGAGGENTSGVNPDDVFTFTASGSGSRAAFDSLNGDFKTAVCKMGAAYKQKTGSKIAVSSTFRSQEEQTVLYEAWRAAGGNLQTKPVVDTPRGRIFTPAKTVGSHAGLAMDSGQMQVVVNTLGAAAISELGLKWGGTFSTPDVVHIQLAASPKPAAETVVRPPLNLP